MKLFKNLIETAHAHCDIPCGIYDPHQAQIGALTVIRMMDIIKEHAQHIAEAEKNHQDALEFRHGIIRAIKIKEDHAEMVKYEVRIIWGDYFKPEMIEKYLELHGLVHGIMQLASKSKQTVDRAEAIQLLEKVNRFAEIFWETKGVKINKVKAPYKPSEEMVVPVLE